MYHKQIMGRLHQWPISPEPGRMQDAHALVNAKDARLPHGREIEGGAGGHGIDLGSDEAQPVRPTGRNVEVKLGAHDATSRCGPAALASTRRAAPISSSWS